MFSNETVAAYINEYFEPVWISVRPVPIVTIDFGNGNVLKRTLHGNVASYVCDADGRVLDVLPGIYQPDVYLEQIEQLARLHQTVLNSGKRQAGQTVGDYHRTRLEALTDTATQYQPSPAVVSPNHVALWVDTQINETTRRRAIHQYLAENGMVQPDEIKAWLYREVLHADLDDPWLGLNDVLFADYPFAGEDGYLPVTGN